MNRWKSTMASLAAVCLLVGSAPALPDVTRTRASFSAETGTVEELVQMLDPPELPPGVGEVSVHVSVGFDRDSAKLPEAAKRDLALVAEAMSATGLRSTLVVVEGHTDSSGDLAYNDTLSLERARSAAEYLITFGVPQSRLALRGMGETDLLPGIGPLSAEQRRIEFVRRFEDVVSRVPAGAEGATCGPQPVLSAHGLAVLKALSDSLVNPVFSPEGLRSVLEVMDRGASEKARRLIADYYLSQSDTNGPTRLQFSECSWRPDSTSDKSPVSAVAMNLMFIREGITPNLDVVQGADETSLGAELHSIPDRGFQEWLQTINLGIERTTGGRVKDALALKPETAFAVSNILSFDAPWLLPFDESMTEPAPFHLADGTTVTVPMMSSGERTVLIAEDDRFSRILLPYADNDHYMHLLVPRGAVPPSEPEASSLLDRVDARTLGLRVTRSEYSDAPVIDWKGKAMAAIVFLPRFEVDGELELSDHMKAAGYSELFTDIEAFGGLTDSGLLLDRISQDIHLRTDESGSRVSAVTTAEMTRSDALIEIQEIRFDRPFLYVVGQASSGALLAMGVVGNPLGGG